MTETSTQENAETAEKAVVMARLWEIADQARALARTYSDAEEALDVLEETDPPPESEHTELDADDTMVAPPDPMPPTFEGSEPDEGPDPTGPPALSWGTLARTGLALGTAFLTGWAGTQLLQYPAGLGEAQTGTFLLWLPGALVALATSGAALSLRRETEAPDPFRSPRRRTHRWSVPASVVFVVGTLTSVSVLGLWTLWSTGHPALVGLAAAVGFVALFAQVPPRVPGPMSWSPPGSLLGLASERSQATRRRRENRRTARQWRRQRGRSRAAIRTHTEAWQAVHHRCHLEVELGNPQAEQLAAALFVLRGSMFGRELPGDSDDSPAVAPLTGNLEVAVHNLTTYHPDRLTRRLRKSHELARGEAA